MYKFTNACIIEDNPASVFWIKELMEEANFAEHILVYKNGHAAYEQLSSNIEDAAITPDIIFLDLNMPVMDGWQFLQAFTQLKPAKKILIYILTSSVDPEDTVKVLQYNNVQGYLVKPITETDLKKILLEQTLTENH